MALCGGGAGSTNSTVTQTNLPEYAEPYWRDLLDRTQYESLREYQPYQGQRISEFSDYENLAMQGMGNMAWNGTPQETQLASSLADPSRFQNTQYQGQYMPGYRTTGYESGAFNPGVSVGDYQQGGIGSNYQTNPNNFQSSYQPGSRNTGYQAGPFDAGVDVGDYALGGVQSQYGANRGDFQNTFQAGNRQSAYQAGPFDAGVSVDDYALGGVQSQYDPNSASFQNNFEPGAMTDPGAIPAYMSPYQQNVTDVAVREAERKSDIQSNRINDAATHAGGLGGYREAIMLSENQRNLNQQIGDIQYRGSQDAFSNAQQAYEVDRQARLSDSTLDLQAAMGLDSAYQSKERFSQSGYQVGEQARLEAARLGLSAQEQEDAARRAQEQFGQSQYGTNQQYGLAGSQLDLQGGIAADSAFQTQEQLSQAGYQIGEQARMQAAQMGLSAQEQEDAARQAMEQFGQSQFATNQQYGLAAGQLDMQGGIGLDSAYQSQEQLRQSSFEVGEQARMEAARIGLSAQEQEEAARQAMEEFGQRQFATNQQYGLAGGQYGLDVQRAQQDANMDTRNMELQSADLLRGIGGERQQMDIERLINMQAAGENQRNLNQQSLSMGYQDFMDQKDYPRQQLAFYEQILQGLPVTPGTNTSAYQPSVSDWQTALGTGIAGVGLYSQLGG
jgi:hypothetical protein